jgi:hypothetical protein
MDSQEKKATISIPTIKNIVMVNNSSLSQKVKF